MPRRYFYGRPINSCGHGKSCQRLDAVAVLHSLGHRRRKRRGVTAAGLVFKNLRPVLGHHTANVDIEDLSAPIADFPLVAGRQCRTVDRQEVNGIRVLDDFQRRADAPRLPAGFVRAGGCFAACRKTVLGRWLAAIAAIQAQAIGQQLHEQDQHIQRRTQGGRQVRLRSEQVFNFFDRGVQV